jgi:hypothetical protein
MSSQEGLDGTFRGIKKILLTPVETPAVAINYYPVPESVEFEVLLARKHLTNIGIFGNIRVDAIHPVGEAHVMPTAPGQIGHISNLNNHLTIDSKLLSD